MLPLQEFRLHLVPVPPTLTKAQPGENPASRGSSREAQAATTSSRVLNGFCENGWAAKGWFASAILAVDMSLEQRMQTESKTPS